MLEFWTQIGTYCDNLPRSQDDFFLRLWRDSRLRFKGVDTTTDWIDKCSAQILCAALSRRKPILIVLPDEAPHRIPMLFATVLLMKAVDSILYGEQARDSVIYFGTMAGIRGYLNQTYAGRLSLSEVFSQINLRRNGTPLSGDTLEEAISNVVFSYTPVDPQKIVAKYNPAWSFCDCSVGERLDWVSPVLRAFTDGKIPAVGCVQNPLANAIEEFEQAGWLIYQWPYPTYETLPDIRTLKPTIITPIVLESSAVLEQSEKFEKVYSLMFEVSQRINGRFAEDAQRAVWRYIRALERLVTPYIFYEAEYKDYWRIYSLEAHKNTAEEFVRALCETSNSYRNELPIVMTLLREIHKQLATMDPPLWSGLCELCVGELPNNEARVIVFPAKARRDLFSHALLSYHNISTQELAEINVWLVSLRQFTQWQREREHLCRIGGEQAEKVPRELLKRRWRPLLIGVPFRKLYPRCVALLRHSQVDVLIYPHQYNAFRRHYEEWEARMPPHKSRLPKVLSLLQRKAFPLGMFSKAEGPKRLQLGEAKALAVESTSDEVQTRMQGIFRAKPRVDEIAWLLQIEDDEFSQDLSSYPASDDAGEPFSDEPMIAKQAFHVQFKEGYDVLFHPSQTIQVIARSNGSLHLDERVARSLCPRDEVLFIHGQRRQSLYELILSRVHTHPSFLPHLNLIERWQDELIGKFRESKLSLDEVLRRMQHKGSNLQTSQAIRFWLYRHVLCPRDSKDLKRIAEVLDMPFVKEYHKQIGQAATRLRGLHIKVARGLNQWLQEEAIGASQERLEKVIDPQLGLKLSDFQDALLRLTVEKASLIDGLFLTSELGELRRKDG